MRNAHTTVLVTLAALLAASGVAEAQTGHVISPSPVYKWAEGPGYATSFGSFSSGHYQFADGNLGNAALTLKQVAFRYDHRSYGTSEGMGRSWVSVSLDMAECTLGSTTTTFTANSLSTPTRVFQNSLNWPIQLGVRRTMPDGWSLTMPFSSNWTYSGKNDLLTDYTFIGGTLANSKNWSGTSTCPYYLDSFNIGHTSVGPGVTLGNINGGCSDSAIASGAGAAAYLDTVTYGANHPTASLRNTMQFEGRATGLAPSSSAVMVLGFNANVAGAVYPGIACNRIHLDTRRTLFMHFTATDSVGAINKRYFFGLPGGSTNYLPAAAGLNIAIQCAWDDSKFKNLRLSSGSRNGLLPVPPFATAAAAKVKVIYSHDPLQTVAGFSHDGNPLAIPLTRYAY